MCYDLPITHAALDRGCRNSVECPCSAYMARAPSLQVNCHNAVQARNALALQPEAEPLRDRHGHKVGPLARQHIIRRASRAALSHSQHSWPNRLLLQQPAASSAPASRCWAGGSPAHMGKWCACTCLLSELSSPLPAYIWLQAGSSLIVV